MPPQDPEITATEYDQGGGTPLSVPEGIENDDAIEDIWERPPDGAGGSGQ